MNAAHLPNVEIVPRALSDAEGVTTFYETRSTIGSSIIERDDAKAHRVETTSVDALLAGRDVSALLVKLNIEGAEHLALRGMRETLALVDTVAILIEVDPPLLAAGGTDVDAMLDALRSQGFAVAYVDLPTRNRGRSRTRSGRVTCSSAGTPHRELDEQLAGLRGPLVRQLPPRRRSPDDVEPAAVAAPKEHLRPGHMEGRRDDDDRAPAVLPRKARDRARFPLRAVRDGVEADDAGARVPVPPAEAHGLRPVPGPRHGRDREDGSDPAPDQLERRARAASCRPRGRRRRPRASASSFRPEARRRARGRPRARPRRGRRARAKDGAARPDGTLSARERRPLHVRRTARRHRHRVQARGSAHGRRRRQSARARALPRRRARIRAPRRRSRLRGDARGRSSTSTTSRSSCR